MDKKRKTYAAMVSAVDDGVGQVLDKLQDLELENNTIVVFLSDNGGPETKNKSNNGHLRDGKGSIYEGGFRVPFAMQWKGKVKPQVYDFPVSALDILGTISSLSNLKIDEDKPLDGVNLIPYLNGDLSGSPHDYIFLRKFDQKLYTVRDANLKLVVKMDGAKKELYNLGEDISESNNIAKQYPNEVARLNTVYDTWQNELSDPSFLGLIHTKAWKKKVKKNKIKYRFNLKYGD
jgi:arylsulfatase A-like enzyme